MTREPCLDVCLGADEEGGGGGDAESFTWKRVLVASCVCVDACVPASRTLIPDSHTSVCHTETQEIL